MSELARLASQRRRTLRCTIDTGSFVIQRGESRACFAVALVTRPAIVARGTLEVLWNTAAFFERDGESEARCHLAIVTRLLEERRRDGIVLCDTRPGEA